MDGGGTPANLNIIKWLDDDEVVDYLINVCFRQTINQPPSYIDNFILNVTICSRQGPGPGSWEWQIQKIKIKHRTGQQLQWPEDFIRRIKLLGYEDYYRSKILSFYVLWLMYLLLLPTSSMIHSDIIDHTEKWVLIALSTTIRVILWILCTFPLNNF